MLIKNTSPIKDKDQKEILDHILQEAFGNPISLDSAPVTATPLLNANEWGKYDTNIYFRIANDVCRIAIDEVISVT